MKYSTRKMARFTFAHAGNGWLAELHVQPRGWIMTMKTQTIRLTLIANKQEHSHEFSSRAEAMAEALKIRKWDFAAEALIYRDDVLVAWISHCPTASKGEKWRT
jgi:hypothetical protein